MPLFISSVFLVLHVQVQISSLPHSHHSIITRSQRCAIGYSLSPMIICFIWLSNLIAALPKTKRYRIHIFLMFSIVSRHINPIHFPWSTYCFEVNSRQQLSKTVWRLTYRAVTRSLSRWNNGTFILILPDSARRPIPIHACRPKCPTFKKRAEQIAKGEHREVGMKITTGKN